MKHLVLITALTCTGCATVGDLEVLNDMGRAGRTTGQVMRTIESSCRVMSGHNCEDQKQRLNTSTINMKYGNVKQLPYVVRTRNIPYILQEAQDLPR